MMPLWLLNVQFKNLLFLSRHPLWLLLHSLAGLLLRGYTRYSFKYSKLLLLLSMKYNHHHNLQSISSWEQRCSMCSQSLLRMQFKFRLASISSRCWPLFKSICPTEPPSSSSLVPASLSCKSMVLSLRVFTWRSATLTSLTTQTSNSSLLCTCPSLFFSKVSLPLVKLSSLLSSSLISTLPCSVTMTIYSQWSTTLPRTVT